MNNMRENIVDDRVVLGYCFLHAEYTELYAAGGGLKGEVWGVEELKMVCSATQQTLPR
jgi:hypothetical protein